MAKKYVIVGNPNTGKTTLFNNITHSNQKTANYSGVTVDSASKKVNFLGESFEVVDLPGIYTLYSDSEDEIVTKNYLKRNQDNEIVYVCSSCDIKKNLILLSELANLGYKLKIVINSIGKKLENKELENLKQELNVPILQVDVRKNKNELISWLTDNIAKSIEKQVDIKALHKIFRDNYESIKSLDKILLHPVWGKGVFFVVFFAVIAISYGSLGNSLSLFVESKMLECSSWFCDAVGISNVLVIKSLWDDVVIGAVGTVIIYMPQLALMLSLMFLLEDVGYLSRVASVFNIDLESLGMNGKSIFSLSMGMGCTTSAVLVSRNIGSINARKNTVKLLPFIGCSAKIPIIIYISQVILGGFELAYVVLLYIVAMTIGCVYLKVSSKDSTGELYISEISPIKFPSIKRIVGASIKIVFDLLKKVLITIFLSALILWLLMNMSITFKFFTSETSILEYMAEYVAYLFYPIGLNRVDCVIALIFGLIAKENVVSIMGMFGSAGALSVETALTFLIFVVLYSPCIPALRCVKCEFGKRYARKIFFSQFLIAYLGSFVFSTFSKISIVLGFLMIIIFCVFTIMLIGIAANRKKDYQKTTKFA